MAEGITVEKSQRSVDETPWYWPGGDTYPHRELLKRHGARVSGRRRQWYVIGTELPPAIATLVTEPTVPGVETPAPPMEAPAPVMSAELQTMIEVALEADRASTS